MPRESPPRTCRAAQGLGLLQADEGPVAAIATLTDARTRCVRWPDSYQWIHAYILDATCAVALATNSPKSACPADDLLELAARTNMGEFVVRAQLHRASLGITGAAAAARLTAAAIDNPALHQLVSAPSRTARWPSSAHLGEIENRARTPTHPRPGRRSTWTRRRANCLDLGVDDVVVGVASPARPPTSLLGLI
jgi:hypothetical protein